MNILLLGGTFEARILAKQLENNPKYFVTVSMAGVTKAPLKYSENMRFGGFGGQKGLKNYLKNNNIDVLVDATHPFASNITYNAKVVCEELNIPRILYERKAWIEQENDKWLRLDCEHDLIPHLNDRDVVFIASGRQSAVHFKDQKITITKPSDAINQGIVYLSEERQQLGMTGLMSVKDNINMAIMDGNSQFYIMDTLKEIKNASAMQEKLNIKVSYWSQLTQSLSGGNQQKTVIAKWLSTKPEVLILDEPTKGIDVRSKSAVHEFMGELVGEGMSIIMVSSELPEILGMCDRVVVMYKGLIKDILDVKNASSEQIVKLASGES